MFDSSDPRLTAYVLGELDGGDRAEIERQLKQSAELRSEVAAIREATALLSDGLETEPCPTLSDEQRSAIQPRAEDSVALSEFPRKSLSRRLAEFTAIAAVVAILFLLARPAIQLSSRGGTNPTKVLSQNSTDARNARGDSNQRPAV
jgi:anti-sigma factor RsiW